jgi:CPA2 family monovalent cation:H+ antiporter-2
MDASGIALQPILVLLAASVIAVALCRRLALPPMVGYLATGLVLGPYALGFVPADQTTRHLGEFGVVFLMFSVGLEFSLPKLRVMRRAVFGLGLTQVVATIAVTFALMRWLGFRWEAGLAIGSIVAMSSTAIVSKLVAERLELDSAHGRDIIGVLLFQDLAVVPLLILIPALGQPPDAIGREVGVALAKGAVVLAVLILVGPRLMRAWFGVVARRRSTELFVLNVLLITLGLAFVTGIAGLSLALGAFLAGMLISETQYRYQVEEDIKPFRDVLLGLFFIVVGATLDVRTVAGTPLLVLALLVALMGGKLALIGLLARAFGAAPGTALRTALALAQGGEFGFVLFAQMQSLELVSEPFAQALLAAMILSMLATPFVIAASDRIVLRFARSEWMARSLQLHQVAVKSLATERHVVVLGYGRNGQRLARLLDAEGVRYVALDLDPERVREAVIAGDSVVFADCTRRESLVAAGIGRAAAAVISFSDIPAAERVLAHVRALNPTLPVIARAAEERDIGRLTAAGASEVVPEAIESGLMLASHALVWVGIPLNRVVRRMRQVRDAQYGLLRGLYHGASDEADSEAVQPRLHGVTLEKGARAIGQPLVQLELEALEAQVHAVRRPGVSVRLSAEEAGSLQAGDVVVLLGVPAALAAAEERLLRGG